MDSGRSCPLISHYSDPCKSIIEFEESTLRKSHYFYEDVILTIKLSENDCQIRGKDAKIKDSSSKQCEGLTGRVSTRTEQVYEKMYEDHY